MFAALTLSPLLAAADQVTPSPSVTSGLVVRAAPNASAAPVGSLLPGQRAELLDDVPYWHHIRLTSGQKGYAWKGLADVVPDPPPVIADDLLGALTSVPAIARNATAMNIHVIDVGQGAATLFEFPCGTLLIDTGGEDNPPFSGVDRLLTYLDAFFAGRPDLGGRLDTLLLTHPHKDHTLAACKVIERYKPRNLVDNGTPGTGEGKPGQECLQDAAATGTPYEAVRLDDVPGALGVTSPVIDPLNCDQVDPDIRVLFGSAPSTFTADVWNNPNNNSVVVRVGLGSFSFLVTGDLEQAGITKLLERTDPAVLDVGIYQVGHHGSKNATTRPLLQALTAEVAIVAMGDSIRAPFEWSAWRYGHPSDEALTLLIDAQDGVSTARPAVTKAVGLKGAFNSDPPEWTTWTIERGIYGTGWDGSIMIHADANGTSSVTTSRP